MASSLKENNSYWYGYLMAGERSSPVLRDTHLESGNPKTYYLFNLKRGEIIEYASEIVDKKLRDLKPNESRFIAELDAGYKKALRDFKGPGRGKRNLADPGVTTLWDAKDFRGDEVSEISMDDADLWLESE
jgi:hypothetical protein